MIVLHYENKNSKEIPREFNVKHPQTQMHTQNAEIRQKSSLKNKYNKK